MFATPPWEWHADLAPLVMVSDRSALRVELTEAPHGRVQRGEDPMRPIDSPAPAKKIGNRPPCSVVNVSRNRTPSPRRSRRDNSSRRRQYLRPTLRRVAVWGEGWCTVFYRLGRVQHEVLPEAGADELHALGEAVVGADGHRARRQAEQVDRNDHPHGQADLVEAPNIVTH